MKDWEVFSILDKMHESGFQNLIPAFSFLKGENLPQDEFTYIFRSFISERLGWCRIVSDSRMNFTIQRHYRKSELLEYRRNCRLMRAYYKRMEKKYPQPEGFVAGLDVNFPFE